MKRLTIITLCICLAISVSACTHRNNPGDSVSTSSDAQQSGESESSSVEYSSQAGSTSAESSDPALENTVAVSMINLNESIVAFDMKENDTGYGWTLTEIEPSDTPPEAAFYGFLTFTGEVTLSGVIRHVNAIYDGFEFIPDEDSKGKILIPDGNPEKEFFVTIANVDDPSIAESIADLAVNESGEYSVVLTQYRLAYVPMMATNHAVVSNIKRSDADMSGKLLRY